MDRAQLLRLMPRDKDDADGARAIVEIGLPAAAPVLCEIIQLLRTHDSVVATEFARLLAVHPGPSWSEVASELQLGRNDAIKHALVASVVCRWPAEWVAKVAPALQIVATHAGFFETDLLCIDLLERHALADRAGLRDWLAFKEARLERHRALAGAIAARLREG
ncbi:MAG TPA: hypothetical protein VIZ64_09445 [Dokdonella sp.]